MKRENRREARERLAPLWTSKVTFVLRREGGAGRRGGDIAWTDGVFGC